MVNVSSWKSNMLLLFAGTTPDPLDHLFGWQLLTILQAIGALRVDGNSGCGMVQVSYLHSCVYPPAV